MIDQYFPYIFGAYSAAAIVLGAVTLATWLRYRRAQGILRLIESSGGSRRR